MFVGGAIPPRNDLPCSNANEVVIVTPINHNKDMEVSMKQTQTTEQSKTDKTGIIVGAINLIAALMA